MIKHLLSLPLGLLILLVPANANGENDDNVEFLIKNTNGDRLETSNIQLKIFDEKNEEIKTLLGSQNFVASLPKNHMYQIDVYLTDFLVSTEYFYFDKPSLVTLTIPNSHGVVFSVSYNDGKPFKNAEIILYTNKNTEIFSATTDLEGKTIRMWIPPTIKTGDSYKVVVREGNMDYSLDNLAFMPSKKSQFSITVPWPSITESLIEISPLDNAGNKFDEKNFVFSLVNQDSEVKYSPTSIIKGNIFISQIPYGDYSILMSEKNSNNSYQSESFQIHQNNKFQVIFPNYLFNGSIPSEEIQKTGLTCNCVAFRLDDVQNNWLNDVQIAVMDVFRETQNPLTIGVIAKGIDSDEKIQSYIDSRLKSKPELEIANHSYDHTPFANFSFEQQNEMLKKSNDKINEVFSISPKVVIPPEHSYDDSTINVLKFNKYTHYSSEFDFSIPPFPLKGEQIYHFPGGAETGHLNKQLRLFEGLSSEETMKEINSSMSKFGFAVVIMHPQEFSVVKNGGYTNEVNSEQIAELKNLLSNIRAEGLRVVSLGNINLGPPIEKEELPTWLKSTARWWGKDQISDREFIDGLQFLIQNKIISVSESNGSLHNDEIPSWVKNNARWWANNQISNEEFVRGIQFMVDSNIIQLA